MVETLSKRSYNLISCSFEHDLRETSRFQSSKKTYTYITTTMTRIAVGDHVIVKSPTTGLTCVKVTSIETREMTYQQANAFKWVYFHVPASYVQSFEDGISAWRKNAQAELELEKELETAMKDAMRNIQIQELAKANPHLMDIYERLQAVRKVNHEDVPSAKESDIKFGFFIG